MSLDAERKEQLRVGIATTLGRLRGDVIPLPIANAAQEPSSGPDQGSPTAQPILGDNPLRADPDMKTSSSTVSGGIAGILGAPSQSEDQPDLLSGLEPPQLPSPMSEEERATRDARRRKRRLLVAVGAGLVLILAAGFWTMSGDSPEEVPLITAEQTPEKVKPEDEGGLEVANQGIAILEDPQASASPSQVETVLPPPEQPLQEAPISSDQPTDGAIPSDITDGAALSGSPASTGPQSVEELIIAAPDVPELTSVPSVGNGSAADMTGELATPPVPEMPSVPAMPSSGALTETEPTSTAAIPDESVSAPSASVETQPDESTASQEESVAATAATPTAALVVQPTPGGSGRIQLAAVKSEEGARAHWATLQAKYPALLGALELTVQRVDKGADGIFYRVQAGPLSDRTAAKKLCAELKQQNQDCLAVQ